MNLPKYVEIETSRYCNRQCEWCPNHPLQNRTAQELLPWKCLERVVHSLSNVQYSGWLAFHNYNEPLSNPRLPKELEFVREFLPNAKPTIYTNGDRLTPELFEILTSAGLSQMRLTIYPKNRHIINNFHEPLWAWLKRRPFLDRKKWDVFTARQGPALVHDGPPELQLINPNISNYYDRGGTLSWLTHEKRTKPCFLTSNSLSIDYHGNIKMCCNVVSDHPSHKEYIIGNVINDDVIEVWCSSKFHRIRVQHERSDWSETPICITCHQELSAANYAG